MKKFFDVVSYTQLESLVSQHGSPLVVTSEAIIRERCQVLRSTFPSSHLNYAVKANYNPWLLKIVADEGFGVDAVSPNEVALALQVGVPAAQIYYIENNMTDDDMHQAVQQGVNLVVGSISRLEKYAQAYPNTKVWVRVNGDVGPAHHAKTFTAGPTSKFGIHHTDLASAQTVAAEYGVRITTLQQHIGSGWLEVEPFLEAMEVLLDLVKTMPEVKHLDFGGGFGVPYKPEQSHLDYEALGESFAARMAAFESETSRTFTTGFEPGRFIMAESAVLLATCNTRKIGADGRVFIGTDTGFNHLIRPAMYESYHHITNITQPSGAAESVDVCGNLCESSDFFARQRALPPVAEGDVLAISDVGAYGLVQGSPYNLRGFPAEVLVKTDGRTQLIRRRESLEDLLQGFEYSL